MIKILIIAEDKPEICEAINVFVMVSANYQCKYTTFYSEEMPLIHILLKSVQSVIIFLKKNMASHFSPVSHFSLLHHPKPLYQKKRKQERE